MLPSLSFLPVITTSTEPLQGSNEDSTTWKPTVWALHKCEVVTVNIHSAHPVQATVISDQNHNSLSGTPGPNIASLLLIPHIQKKAFQKAGQSLCSKPLATSHHTGDETRSPARPAVPTVASPPPASI